MTTEDHFNNIEFFDGETIQDKYFELGNSETYIRNDKGLTLKQSLEFLFLESKLHNYFFRIDYDLNMMFAKEKLTEKVLSFFNSETVKYYNYELTYFRHKIFIIKDLKTNKVKRFYDISNFYKTSFIKTLKILKIDIPADYLSILEKNKKRRNVFDFSFAEEIIKYNKIECKLGIEIVKKIYDLLPSNLKTFALYGASGLSQKFLFQLEIDKKNWFWEDVLNDKVFESAYFGGRIECLKVGTQKNCYKYDINSGYPTTINELKTVENIEIKEYNAQKIIKTNLYNIELTIYDSMLFGLLPYRLKSGYLIFPNEVKGWYYGTEILEILKYIKVGFDIDLKINKFLDIKLGNFLFENNEIENIYKKRKKLKKQKNETQYILKILLNAQYGKFAQQIGKAQFQNFYYAGYITADTRAKLLSASITNPYGITFFSTDGILSDKKLDVKINDNLGGWEQIHIKKSVSLLAGIYKCIDYNDNIYEGERGFRMDFDKTFNDIQKNGFAEIELNLFIGNKYYKKNEKAFRGYRCKFKKVKKIINPTHQIKRIFNFDNKINLNKLYNSFIITNEIKKEIMKIKKREFTDFSKKWFGI